MQSVFQAYSAYYDLLYRDKDYPREAAFILDLIKEFAPGASSILELGCGTALHAQHIAQSGLRIHGVEISEHMCDQAARRIATLPQEHASRIAVSQADVRTVRLAELFDVVISLFHVVSYQTTNDDLQAMLETARVHLKPGGVFIFDCWYGPCVLSEQPTVRVKRVADAEIQVTRIAEPRLWPNENVVDVNYHIFVRDVTSGDVEELKETHRMRYLFSPELEDLLQRHDMPLVGSGEWMTRNALGADTWSAYFVGRKG